MSHSDESKVFIFLWFTMFSGYELAADLGIQICMSPLVIRLL